MSRARAVDDEALTSRRAGAVHGPAPRQPVKWSSVATAVVFLLTALAASAIRLTVRDHVASTAFIYYGAQPIVIAAAAIIAALGALTGRMPRLCRISLLLAAAWLGVWLARDWRFARQSLTNDSQLAADGQAVVSASPQRLRAMHWNLAHGRFGWPSMMERIAAERADIIALSEAWAGKVSVKDLLARLGPDYVMTGVRNELALAVRGQVIDSRDGHIEMGLSFKRSRVRTRLGELVVLQIDLPSTFTSSRADALRLADLLVEKDAHEPLLVLGDFNLPPDSVLFDPLRERLTSAFDAAGRGYRATWPVPLPFLALDQIWCNDRLVFHSMHADTTARSDHRLLLADFSFAGAENR